MRRTLIASALFAALQTSAFADCPPVHTKIDVGVDRESIQRDSQCQSVTSVPTTSENVLIALSGTMLALGLLALGKRNG